jgi:hypothetical protein
VEEVIAIMVVAVFLLQSSDSKKAIRGLGMVVLAMLYFLNEIKVYEYTKQIYLDLIAVMILFIFPFIFKAFYVYKKERKA